MRKLRANIFPRASPREPSTDTVFCAGRSTSSRIARASIFKYCACRQPTKAWLRRKKAMIPIQIDCFQIAPSASAPPPTKPTAVAMNKLLNLAQRKPKEGAQNLAAVEGINRQKIEEKQTEVDPPKPKQHEVGVAIRGLPSRRARRYAAQRSESARAQRSRADRRRCSRASRPPAAADSRRQSRPGAREQFGSPGRRPDGRRERGRTRAW